MEKLALMPIFADGMILQRDRSFEIWGRAEGRVTVRLDGASASAQAENGRFRVTLPPHAAGTGCVLTAECGDERISLSDVCFGDVFMFSGQSNFETPCRRVLDVSEKEIAEADYPYIREYKINAGYSFDGPADGVTPGVWKRAGGAEIYDMSAPAFFFAKELYERSGVPIGIVLNAIGGSGIGSWMPRGALDEKQESFLARYFDLLSSPPPSPPPGAEDPAERWDREINRGEPEKRDGFFDVPGMTMGTALDGFCGSVWFYKEVRLDSEPEGDGFIYVGELIDSDETYVNGIKVGETGYRYPPRKYPVPAGILKKGKNEIKLRLVINGGQGGFIPEHPYWLRPGENGEKIPLSGRWEYAVEGRSEPPAFGGGMMPPAAVPTGLFNSAIAPLRGLRFRGVLWYQGESDTGEAAEYTGRFKAMIKGWREALDEDFGLICVEMPDYCDPITGTDPGWAEMQKVQRELPEHVSGCVTVSARDLGAPFELHPQYKKELGVRLAAAGRKLFY